MERPTVLETEWDVRSVIRKEALSQMNTSDNEGAGALESQRGMPSIKELVVASCEETPQPLDVAYSFVRAWRGQEIAEETIRARMYEALKEGKIIRVARGVYFARSGTAQLVLFEGDAWEAMPKVADDSVDCIITDHPFKLGTDKWVGMGTTRPHAKMGERTYAQRDIDEEWLRNAFRILRKDKAWNTINKERKLAGDWPVGGGACALFVPSLTRTTWPHVRKLIDLAESVGFVFYGSVTWDKVNMGMGYHSGRDQKMEVLVFTAGEILLFTAGERNGVLWDLSMPNVLSEKKLKRKCAPDAVEHEAEKPAALWLTMADALTREGDVVADFHVGRGRWIKQMLEMGRHVIAGDIDGTWPDRIATEDFGFVGAG